AIEAGWNQLSPVWSGETSRTLHHLLHTLAGSSATYGFAALGQTAHRLEQCLQVQIAANAPPTLEEWQHINQLMLLLRQQVTTQRCAFLRGENDRSFQDIPTQTASTLLSECTQRLVYLVEEDSDLARELALQISYFGYQVCTFHRLGELDRAIAEKPPAAIITDILAPSSDLAEKSSVTQTQKPPFIIFTSVRHDLVARLQAVRAGGDAYFVKPINVNELIDKLDELIGYSQPEPYRILIVEDDRALAEFHALILQQAGMVTQIVTNPLQVMQPLSEFKPDLVLMDIYMPSCNGLELAAVIRQQRAYVGIPIVFLSMETDLNKQLAAMSLGGDDFLTKPIQPDHLVSSVASRAQRSAILRSRMVRDSLTGLYNHTKIQEQLAIELKRAARQSLPLSFAMLDIDCFKLVNDTYGHPAGDRVIKSLARLLQQRLRQTDVVGRYGGEEFAVILVDTDADAAIQVMDQIRQSFSQIQQRTEGSYFNVTFSCGIAVFPSYADVMQITQAADRSLYTAKHNGRNQVVLAS
ncbi:diguanylate cyclase, partial [Leptolyngbya sp. FACHB-36]|uniref:diguanylate cyclase n=1 Tax=Leptolyngbya sp. FACHB-36 TaxID=2692808 RepID=UPI001680893E